MGMLKKLALVSAMSAVTVCAQAELSLLEDGALGDVVGQAGVTIEMEVSVGIDTVAYKDEGSVLINNIQIGGLTTLDASQDAFLANSVLGMTGQTATTENAGSLAALMVYLGGGGPFNTDIATTLNDIATGAGASLDGNGNLPTAVVQQYVTNALINTKAQEYQAANGGTIGDAQIAVTPSVTAAVAADLDHYVSVVGTSRLNLAAYGAGDFEVAGTREAIKNIKQTIDVNSDGDLVIHVGSTFDTPILLGLQVGDVQLQSSDGSVTSTLLSNVALKAVIGPQDIVVHNGTGTHKDGSPMTGVSIDVDAYFAVADLDLDVRLGTGSIGIRNVTISDNGGFAKVSQTIYADSKGLVIESGDMSVDIGVGGVFLGNGDNATNNSIGSLAISGLNMSGSTSTIYGHN